MDDFSKAPLTDEQVAYLVLQGYGYCVCSGCGEVAWVYIAGHQHLSTPEDPRDWFYPVTEHVVWGPTWQCVTCPVGTYTFLGREGMR